MRAFGQRNVNPFLYFVSLIEKMHYKSQPILAFSFCELSDLALSFPEKGRNPKPGTDEWTLGSIILE
jgi:hypothetical protein